MCKGLRMSSDTWSIKGHINLFDSNRGSKCFGCLVSTEAHGDDSFQVLFRNALCWRGPRTRTAARQHQRGCEICSRPDSNAKSEQTARLLNYFTLLCYRTKHFFQLDLRHPYGSWSSLWQHRFQCSQYNKPLSCTLPMGTPFHINGRQWSHQGQELKVKMKMFKLMCILSFLKVAWY